MTSENRCTRAVGHVIHRARYYDPSNGRFNQRDTFEGVNSDPGSLHKYAYASCDPVNAIDPSGKYTLVELLSWTAIALIGFAIFLPVINTAWQNAQLKTELIEMLSHMSMAGSLEASSDQAEVEALAAAAVEAAVLLARMAALLRAVREALNQAAKIGRQTLQQLLKLPKYLIVRSLGKTIFDFNVACLAARPDWFLLNYLGPRMQGPNRAWVKSTYAAWYPAPAGYQVDEFPYASTREGGPRGPAVVHYAPTRENFVQGVTLSVFYRFSRLRGRPGTFLLVPVPI